MPEFRVPHPPKLRRQITPEDLSLEFEPTAQSIWNGVRRSNRDGAAGKDAGVISPERGELAKPRRENHRLHQERAILAKSMACSRRD